MTTPDGNYESYEEMVEDLFAGWLEFALPMYLHVILSGRSDADVKIWEETSLSVTLQFFRLTGTATLPEDREGIEVFWRGLLMEHAAEMGVSQKGVLHHLSDRRPKRKEAMNKLLEAIKIKGEKKGN